MSCFFAPGTKSAWVNASRCLDFDLFLLLAKDWNGKAACSDEPSRKGVRMRRPSLHASTFLLLSAVLLDLAGPLCGAQTQDPPRLCCSGDFHIGPSTGQVAGALIGAAAVIGTGTYFLARAPRRTGCVTSDGGLLRLQGTSSADPAYLLEGNITETAAGHRLKVVGRRHKDAQRREVLKVSRIARDYGQCSVTTAMAQPAP